MKLHSALQFLVCIVATAVSLHVYALPGVPYTHDGENHLARFANYKSALREGQFPPRFAPYLMNGYGYPVFNYNYPLANILSVPLTVAGVSYETSFKVIVFTFLSFGAIFLTKWLAFWNISNWSKLLGLFTWLASPFLILTVLYRGSIGELIVYGLLPALLWSVHRLIKEESISLLMIGVWISFFLSHTVSVLWLTPIILSYFCFEWTQDGMRKLAFVRFAKLIMLSFGASLWFWLPALIEMSEIVLQGAGNNQDYLQHFPTIRQMLFAPVQFGYSYFGSVDSMSYAVGVPILFALFGIPLWSISQINNKNNSTVLKRIAGTSFLLLTLFCLQLSFSSVLWRMFPFLRFIQFPWRLGLALPTFAAGGIAVFVHTLVPAKQKIALIIAVLYWITLLLHSPLEYIHNPDNYYDSYAMSTSTQNENRTKSFTFENVGENPRQPVLKTGDAEITDVQWLGSKRSYTVIANTEATIVEPTMRFSGWETRSNGKLLSYDTGSLSEGLIMFHLNPGIHKVQSRFTQRTIPRRIGNTVSLVITVWLLTNTSWQILRKHHA